MDIIKISCSIQPTDITYVKGYRLLSFAKIIGQNISNKYRQKLLTVLKCLQQMQ